MAGATAAEKAQMDAQEARVRTALEKAEEDTASVRWMPSILRTAAQDAALANLAATRKRYEQWADGQGENGWKRWALRGTEPDGFPYPVSFWMRIGNDLLSELGVHVQAAEQGGAVAALEATVAQTAKDVASGAEAAVNVVKNPWPLKWKLAAGGAAGLAGLGLVAWLLTEARPLLALLPTRKEA